MSFFRRNLILSVSAVLALFSTMTLADIFKCEVDGKLVMRDTPCPVGLAQSTVDVVIKNGYKKIDPYAYDKSQFNDWENELIKRSQIAVGMSVEALQQSWGTPKDIHRSSNWPEQWFFRDGMFGQRYAYIRAGKVVYW